MKVTVSNIVDHTVSVFDAAIPYDGRGTAFLGVFDWNEDSGLISWFRHGNPLDPWRLCETLVENGYASKHPGGPGTYGHVDYRVTPLFRDTLAFEAEETAEHLRQQEAEIAAETNIPQHLVW